MRLGLRVTAAACVLLLASCNRRPQPVPVADLMPAHTLALDAANRGFAAGDCVGAARDFQRYLDLMPSGGHRDEALFHLGLINSVPECGRQDWATADGYMKRLLVEFPQSPYRLTAELILSLRDQAARISAEIARVTTEQEQLRNEGTRLRNEIAALQNDTAQLRMSSSQLSDEINRLKAEVTAAETELDKKEQQNRLLRTQLERLIRIDTQPRTRPQ
jgi:outer membrane protein assembly factor BamD (BamD/ComL family)